MRHIPLLAKYIVYKFPIYTAIYAVFMGVMFLMGIMTLLKTGYYSIILFFISIVFILSAGVTMMVLAFILKCYFLSTLGKVNKIPKTMFNDGNIHNLVYEIHYHDHHHQPYLQITGNICFLTLAIGDEIEVLYDKDNPKYMIIRDRISLYYIVLLQFMIAIGLIIIGFMFLF